MESRVSIGGYWSMESGSMLEQSFGVEVVPVRSSLKDTAEGAQWRRCKVSSHS